MPVPLGIYKVVDVDEYVIGCESEGMFLTSEILDADDIEDLITEYFSLYDYELTPERARPIEDFSYVQPEKWVEIARLTEDDDS